MSKTESIESLSDDRLLSHAKTLAAQERALTAKLLRHLLEIDKRLLFAKLGYSSLFSYVTEELGFCAASAQARIASMRLLAIVPEIEEKIVAGSVSLTNLAQAQRFFNQEQKSHCHSYSVAEKKQVIEKLEGKSTRDAERELMGLSSDPAAFARPDQIRAVTPTLSEVRFAADQELLDQLEEIRGLLAHQDPHLSLAALMGKMATITLKKLRADRFAILKNERAQEKEPLTSGAKTEQSDSTLKEALQKQTTQKEAIPKKIATSQARQSSRSPRYTPRPIQREVFARDGYQCCYQDPVSGRRCGSKFALELDHRIPWAKGGRSTTENLVTMCAAHNAWAAVEEFGQQKMRAYRSQQSR